MEWIVILIVLINYLKEKFLPLYLRLLALWPLWEVIAFRRKLWWDVMLKILADTIYKYCLKQHHFLWGCLSTVNV